MKKRLITLFTVVMFSLTPMLSGSNDIDVSRVMALFGDSFAHACPVNGKVKTARHVVLKTTVWGKRVDLRWSWEDSGGRGGVAESGDYDLYRDLGELKIKGDEPSYYAYALSLPKVGETVYWAQFDKKTFKTVRKDAKVKYYRAGYVFFDELPDNGASGSCLFNDEGDVIGIVVWRITKNMGKNGGASLLVRK